MTGSNRSPESKLSNRKSNRKLTRTQTNTNELKRTIRICLLPELSLLFQFHSFYCQQTSVQRVNNATVLFTHSGRSVVEARGLYTSVLREVRWDLTKANRTPWLGIRNNYFLFPKPLTRICDLLIHIHVGAIIWPTFPPWRAMPILALETKRTMVYEIWVGLKLDANRKGCQVLSYEVLLQW